jgi:putative ABC transport system substrate-binding protein
MKRRDFVTLFGGAAAWPLSAWAQQSTRVATIGFLDATSRSTQGRMVSEFVQRLRELGWREGQNLVVEVRWAEGQPERYAEIAAEFVRLKVDVIVTYSLPAIFAAKQATSTIPIVFAAAGDPVENGLVTSLAHPGGNVTGLANQSAALAGKRIELLREIIPTLHRLAVIGNVTASNTIIEMGKVAAAARALGVEYVPLEIQRGPISTQPSPASPAVLMPSMWPLIHCSILTASASTRSPSALICRRQNPFESSSKPPV